MDQRLQRLLRIGEISQAEYDAFGEARYQEGFAAAEGQTATAVAEARAHSEQTLREAEARMETEVKIFVKSKTSKLQNELAATQALLIRLP